MDRLLRLAARKYADSPPTNGGPQERDWSPVSLRSTLITSAPKSPSSMAQYGPASASVISTTRIESRIVSTGRDYSRHRPRHSPTSLGAFLHTDGVHPKLGSKYRRFPQAPLLCFRTLSA